mgnify:CR=1 FL=1
MKKRILCLLAITLALSLAACGETAPGAPEAQPPDAQETAAPAYESGEAEKNDEEWPFAFSREHLETVEAVLVELEPLFNQAAALAVENGWEADELTVRELNTVYALIDLGQVLLEDPASVVAEATEEDMAVIAEQYETLLGAMPALLERVGAPYGAAAGA